MNEHPMDLQLACFNLGDNLFSVDIMRIKEILQPQKLSSLPAPARYLDGVINLRGTVVPVMNLRKRFGLPPAATENPGKLLVVTLHRRILALAVDDVLEVITVPVTDIKPPPELESAVSAECVLGVVLSGDRLFMILNIDTLLDTHT